ncbi:hypothetical protein C8R44DRAFT_563954, partial [Mycena epipterygia]
MPAAFSSDLKERIVQLYLTGDHTMEEITILLGVSIGLVSKVVNLYLQHGQVTDPSSKRTGRPKTLDDEDLRYITEILRANSSLYLDEIQSKLESVRD